MDFDIATLTPERITGIRNCSDWSEACPVSLDILREVHFLHKDFSGQTEKGSMVVIEEIAQDTLLIFEKLFEIAFPIHKAVPVDHFKGSDVASMDANNSSAFNCRRIMDSDRWSSHSYGTAIDINPLQNPYVLIDHEASTAKIYPKGGGMYLNRGILEKGMVEPIVEIFYDHGFTEWGGHWKDRLDYHHFQIPWEKIQQLDAFKN